MTIFETLLQSFVDWRTGSPSLTAGDDAFQFEALLAHLRPMALDGLLFNEAWYMAQNKLPAAGRHPAKSALTHYLKTGVSSELDPTPWFSEAFYRSRYPDVRLGIAAGAWRCGYQHYLLQGVAEHRSPSATFNEMAYLGRYPDILEAVRSGSVPSGALHYLQSGQAEGRSIEAATARPLLDLPLRREQPSLPYSTAFAEMLYRATHPDIPDDGTPLPGLRHWLSAGVAEDLAGTRPRLSGWVENIYARNNPDLAPHIGTTGNPSGYSHFLLHGANEGRRWAGEEWARRERRHLQLALSTRTPMPVEPGNAPLISIIVPVYNPDLPALLACIESVVTQTYPRWQLCLADDASTLPHVQEALVAAERRDHRVRVLFAAANGGISAASNAALGLADGEVVALLDHDDLLAPDALLHLAHAFGADDVDMVYTDEGKITEAGEIVALSPKPGWSPELLLSTMYVGHLTAYRRTLIEELGGFRSMFDGTQDYDLALRASVLARRVVHVPLPLYFWRMSPASTAGSIGAKPGVLQLQQRALQSALVRRGQPGEVRLGHGAGHWTVVLDPPAGAPLVSIVIPTAGRSATIGTDTVDLVANLVHSLGRSETYPNHEVVVVHNGDLGGTTLLQLSASPRVRLVHYRAAPFNLSDKINLGVRAASGEYVLLLNDDMQAESPDIILSMLGRMFEGVGIVGGRLLYADGTLQHAGVVWSSEGPTHAMIGEHRLTPGPAERLRIMHNTLGVSGACMFFRRDVYLDCGGFSPGLALNYNDVDLCLNVRSKGMRIVFNPDVTMFHFESLSKTGTAFWELQLFALAHPGLRDPFWNPTFSQRSPFFELTDPSEPEPVSYRGWLLNRITSRQAGLTARRAIRFSIIMSVYQNKRDQMEALAETVVRQTYDNWEWVIVDDGSSAPETLEWLERIQADPRVRFIRLPTNQGIMAGYGAAFRAAGGDYVVPIDADDFLTLDCLHVLATAIEQHGQPDVVYSDEDKGTETGDSHSPFLKPDWDPVLFSNICYVCHVCAVKRSTAEQVGAYQDNAAAWCHDWDTLLRMKRAGARIEHVPEVLYHWRIHQGSTASMATSTKPYTIDSQRHVLEQDLRLTGADTAFTVVPNTLFPHDGIWRLKPRAEALPPALVIVVASAVPGRTARLLGELAAAAWPAGSSTLVVGHAGVAVELGAMLREVRETLWPGGAFDLVPTVEAAAALCVREGRIAALVDANAGGVNRGWLQEGLGMFGVAPDVAAVGGQVVRADGMVVWQGGYAGFGAGLGAPDHGRGPADSGYHGTSWCQRTCDAVPAPCFLVRPALLESALESAGPGLRAVAGAVSLLAQSGGQRIVYTPFIRVTLGDDLPVTPVLPSGTFLSESRYYPLAFGDTQATAYRLRQPG